MRIANLSVGILFGFLLSRAGATHFDFYAQLFLFENLQLLWVIVTAIVVGVPGILLLWKSQVRTLIGGESILFEDRPWRKGLFFGIGWGLTGSCPGSLPAMLGEGKLVVLPGMLGLLAGTYGYGWFVSRKSADH